MSPTSTPLPEDPEMLAYVKVLEALYPSKPAGATVEEERASYNALCEAFQGVRPDGVAVENAMILAEAPERAIPIRHFRRTAALAPPDMATEGATLLYMHGGGFVVGGLDSHDTVCADLCAASGIDVMAVDYRLAPEHRYPAALEDTEAAYLHLVNAGRRVIVGGDSAGANLAAALCMRARRTGLAMPTGQLLIYPTLGDDFDTPSQLENANAPMLTRADCMHYLSTYTGFSPASAGGDAEICPLAATDYSGLPPAAIFSAGIDPLRDDASLYAERLKQAEVTVGFHNEPQLVHGYLRARTSSRLAAKNFQAICVALAWLGEDSGY